MTSFVASAVIDMNATELAKDHLLRDADTPGTHAYVERLLSEICDTALGRAYGTLDPNDFPMTEGQTHFAITTALTQAIAALKVALTTLQEQPVD